MNKLIVVPSNPPASAGPATKPPIYMPSLDRAVSSVAWSADGQHISFLLQDDRTNHLATVPAGESERHAAAPHHRPPRDQLAEPGKDGNFAVLGDRADAHATRSTRSKARTSAS